MPILPNQPTVFPSTPNQKAIDIIMAAARMSGFLASGESLQDDEPNDCLAILMSMMDEWQADGLKIFTVGITKFPLVAGQQTYTLGPNQQFNLQRPAHYERMGLEMLDNPTQPTERPLEILNEQGWASIRVKNTPGSYPLYCYPDRGYPVENLNFWQIPGLAANVVLYAWQPLVAWGDLNVTTLSFPPAYDTAIKSNLAIRLAAEFKTQPDQLVLGIAQTSLMALKDLNLTQDILTCEGGLSGGRGSYYDWRSDSYAGRG